MRNTIYVILGILLLGLSTGCYESSLEETIMQDNPTEPKRIIQSGFTIQVVNQNQDGVKDVTILHEGVVIGNTDEYGYFESEEIDLNEKGDLIRARIGGYVEGSRTIYPSLKNLPFLKIELLPRIGVQNFSALNGGKITIGQTGEVSFPASSIIYESSGLPYSGVVEAYTHFIDPTKASGLNQMPGDLTAINTDEVEVGLTSFSMINVELFSSSREKLNLKEGSSATVTFPIPEALLDNAPANIPLWYFDLDKKKWIEEGSASKSGKTYVGEVNHFSFWNCDVPQENVKFSITLQNPDMLPIAHQTVRLTTTQGASAVGVTNYQGFVCGRIPKNQELFMEVISFCGDVIYSENIGPFSQDEDYGTLILNVPAAFNVLKGRVLDCSNIVFEGAHVIVWHNGQKYRTKTKEDGTFELNISKCNQQTTSFEIQAINLLSLQASDMLTFNLTGDITDVGDISICGGADFEYYAIKVDTFSFTYFDSISFRYNSASGTFALSGYHLKEAVTDGPYNITYIGGLAFNAPGNYNINVPIQHLYSPGFRAFGHEVLDDSGYDLEFAITQFDTGPGGGYIKGSYTGFVDLVVPQDTLRNVVFNGEFSVKR